jgi:hypothetical protein
MYDTERVNDQKVPLTALRAAADAFIGSAEANLRILLFHFFF